MASFDVKAAIMKHPSCKESMRKAGLTEEVRQGDDEKRATPFNIN